MKDFEIKFECGGQFGYSVYFNGEIILECMNEETIKELTIDEIIGIAKEAME